MERNIEFLFHHKFIDRMDFSINYRKLSELREREYVGQFASKPTRPQGNSTSLFPISKIYFIRTWLTNVEAFSIFFEN